MPLALNPTLGSAMLERIVHWLGANPDLLGTALLAFAAIWISNKVTKAIRNRQIDLRWVQVALDILQRSDPEQRHLQAWAVKVMNDLAPVGLPPELQKALEKGEAKMPQNRRELDKILLNEVQEGIRSQLRSLLVKRVGLDSMPVHDFEVSYNTEGEVTLMVIPHSGKPSETVQDEEGGILVVNVSEPVQLRRTFDSDYLESVAERLRDKARERLDTMGLLDP